MVLTEPIICNYQQESGQHEPNAPTFETVFARHDDQTRNGQKNEYPGKKVGYRNPTLLLVEVQAVYKIDQHPFVVQFAMHRSGFGVVGSQSALKEQIQVVALWHGVVEGRRVLFLPFVLKTFFGKVGRELQFDDFGFERRIFVVAVRKDDARKEENPCDFQNKIAQGAIAAP